MLHLLLNYHGLPVIIHGIRTSVFSLMIKALKMVGFHDVCNDILYIDGLILGYNLK